MIEETLDFAPLDELLDRAKAEKMGLIPVLQQTQEIYGYLPAEVLQRIAKRLSLSPSQVLGVASFYAQFHRHPRGRHIIQQCDGTACHVRKSLPILEAIEKRLNLSDKVKTTPDMLFTVQTVSCLGACGLAPVVMVNEDVHGQVTPEKAVELIDEIYKKEGEGHE